MGDQIALSNDPVTGIPTPVQIDRAALRNALLSNPDVIVEVLSQLLHTGQPGGGGTQPGGTQPGGGQPGGGGTQPGSWGGSSALGTPGGGQPGGGQGGSNRLPMNTPITQMISPSLVETLSPAARKLHLPRTPATIWRARRLPGEMLGSFPSCAAGPLLFGVRPFDSTAG